MHLCYNDINDFPFIRAFEPFASMGVPKIFNKSIVPHTNLYVNQLLTIISPQQMICSRSEWVWEVIDRYSCTFTVYVLSVQRLSNFLIALNVWEIMLIWFAYFASWWGWTCKQNVFLRKYFSGYVVDTMTIVLIPWHWRRCL